MRKHDASDDLLAEFARVDVVAAVPRPGKSALVQPAVCGRECVDVAPATPGAAVLEPGETLARKTARRIRLPAHRARHRSLRRNPRRARIESPLVRALDAHQRADLILAHKKGGCLVSRMRTAQLQWYWRSCEREAKKRGSGQAALRCGSPRRKARSPQADTTPLRRSGRPQA